jgi:hypothetical protein
MKEKQVEMHHKIRKLDRSLLDINLDVAIAIRKIYLGLTGDREDYLTAHQTLFELAVENQNISLLKKDFMCKATVIGVSVTTLNAFEMLFALANKIKKVGNVYAENLAV